MSNMYLYIYIVYIQVYIMLVLHLWWVNESQNALIYAVNMKHVTYC